MDFDVSDLRDVFGQENIIDILPQKSKQRLPKKVSKSKARIPASSSKRIDLAILMDEVEIPKSMTRSNVVSPLEKLQKNLETYLQKELQNCTEDVINEISQYIDETDALNTILPKFISTFKQELRAHLLLDDRRDQFTFALFDEFGVSFFETFRNAEILQQARYSSGTRAIHTALSFVESTKAMICVTMRSSLKDLVKALKSLERARKRANDASLKLDKRKMMSYKTIRSLETKRVMFDIEMESIAKSLSNLQECKQKHYSDVLFDDHADLYNAIRQGICGIKSHMRHWSRDIAPWEYEEFVRKRAQLMELRGNVDAAIDTYLHNHAAVFSPHNEASFVKKRSAVMSAVDISNRKLQKNQAKREAEIDNLFKYLSRIKENLDSDDSLL